MTHLFTESDNTKLYSCGYDPRTPHRGGARTLYPWGSMEIGDKQTFPRGRGGNLHDRRGTIVKSLKNWIKKDVARRRLNFEITRLNKAIQVRRIA